MPSPRKKDTPLEEGAYVPRHEDCWAKTLKNGHPGISVRDHCSNVGCVAEALLALLPLKLQKLIPSSALVLAALHDVGKVSPGFQAKSGAWLVQQSLNDRARNECWSAQESDHAKISQSTVQELFQSPRLHLWAAAVGAHHGQIKGERVPTCEPRWQKERVRLAGGLIEEFGPLPDQPPDDATIWFTAGLITIADWIGSDERHFPQIANWDMPERRKRAQSVVAAIGWKPLEVKKAAGFGDLFPELPEANSLQTVTLELVHEAGLYIIEAPMGYGKTEAALTATYQLIASGKANGLYFALPSQVTSNRIHLRVEPFIGRISTRPEVVRLAHSASWLEESRAPAELHPAYPPDPTCENDDNPEEYVRAGRSWFASAKRALLAPFGVGTIDQALLGIVAAKHFFVRQYGLAGKVVILDEVHTYDLYTSTLIDSLLKQLRALHCTVMILSATLTEKRRRELLGLQDSQTVSGDYPLVSGVADSFVEKPCERPPSKTVQVRNISGSIPPDEALECARSNGCVLWIRNTVDEAQETYRALRSANFQSGPTIALIHSRFPYFRREQLETEWMSKLGKGAADRPHGCVLVSTQVAEQSVDIDADLLITDLAPTDMLLQRLGRLWRHGGRARPCSDPEVWIRMPQSHDPSLRNANVKEIREALGKSGYVYAPYVLLRSLQEWRTKGRITLPDDIRPILEATYADPIDSEPGAWHELRTKLEKQKEKMKNLALSATRIWINPALEDEEGAQTRLIPYRTAQLLLASDFTPLKQGSASLFLLDGTIVKVCKHERNFEAAKAIFRNLARVPRWAVASGHAKPQSWLDNYLWQPAAVGLVQPGGEIYWPGSESETGLSYQTDQGVIIDRTRVQSVAQGEFDESYD